MSDVIQFESDGYMDMTPEPEPELRPMVLYVRPNQHGRRRNFTFQIASAANSITTKASEFREYGIHLTPAQARDLARELLTLVEESEAME